VVDPAKSQVSEQSSHLRDCTGIDLFRLYANLSHPINPEVHDRLQLVGLGDPCYYFAK
jgi:hypothetical protein